MTFDTRKLYWCHEEPISLALLTIAKNEGYYPILGVKGLLEYSRRELIESNIHLPLNLVQGKGIVDIAFTDNEYFVIGSAATITYAFLEYMGYPSRAKYYYGNVVFGSPARIEESYKELKKLGFRLPARVIGKLYKSALFISRYSRTRRLLTNREVVLWAVLPFYLEKEIIVHVQTSISELREHLVNEHRFNIAGLGVLYFNPSSMGLDSPRKLCFECTDKCILGNHICLDDFRRVLGEYKSCTMCKYIDICRRFYEPIPKVQDK